MIVWVGGTSKSSGARPSVDTNTRPAPKCRTHTTGITAPAVSGAPWSPVNVVVASTVIVGSKWQKYCSVWTAKSSMPATMRCSPATEVLVAGRLRRRGHHAAVPPGEAGTRADGGEQPVLLGLGQRATRPALDDEIDGRAVLVDREAVGDGDRVARVPQHRNEQLGALDRPMPVPATPYHQRVHAATLR